MRSAELVALVWGIEAGRVRRNRQGGRLAFAYEDSWRTRADAVPLSLSMPLAARDHGHRPVDAYLWGLLPDNEMVLDRWARRFHVSARSAFSLVAEVGEDCAGAVQFAAPERVEALLDPAGGPVRWLGEAEVAERLRTLREDQTAWRVAGDPGQFSLAGSQPKTALLHIDGRWAVPSGRTPTTHILKPPLRGLDGHVENEHLCLLLAREVGLAAAGSEVRRFGDETAIVVERYDRVRTADLAGEAAAADPARAESLRSLSGSRPVLRLHQEDLCQALALRPALKYQNEGGPAPAAVVELLREHSGRPDADVDAFVDALAFNWVIGGTDAHAKNYSLLHGPGGRVRLAPLYDLASILPYPELARRNVKVAMRIGPEYRLHGIRRRHWIALAREAGLDPDRTVLRLAALAAAAAEAMPGVGARAAADGLDHPVVRRLTAALAARAADCARELAG